MHKILLLATLAAAALAGDSHAKRQVLLPSYGLYPGFVGGLSVPSFPSVGFTSYPYVTYQVSAPTILAPAVATATLTTTTVAPAVAVPADTIKVAAYPIAPAPVAVAAPAVVVGCPGKSEAGVGCPGRNPSKGSHTKISVIQTDD
ncbi:hypothetical protein PRIPAC_82906 [Pristionchus pacificus]|uniref:Uncharacterized protein n=1 Tax=Pristionchus pacificus TaxID=54126 RepID=A0A2A6BY37_PRIPA|nr:hypothetical protein PRIPAC_82906 [Pristionchus pacificus]|eukprot:PDM70798.1 hypothetical protein PRIPAC_45002 [Pristionchus pacificus]